MLGCEMGWCCGGGMIAWALCPGGVFAAAASAVPLPRWHEVRWRQCAAGLSDVCLSRGVGRGWLWGEMGRRTQLRLGWSGNG
jgi:hypothetical protein